MIISMKKAKLVVLKEEKEKLLRSLQKYGELMITSSDENDKIVDTSLEDEFLQKAMKSIKVIKEYSKEKDIFGDITIDYDEFVSIDNNKQKLLEDIENADNEINHIENEINMIDEKINFFLPWENVDTELSKLSSTKYASIHIGSMKQNVIEDFKSSLDEYGVQCNEYGNLTDGQAIIFINFVEDENEVMQIAKDFGFTDIALPKEDILVTDKITDYVELKKQKLRKIEELKSYLNDLSQNADKLGILNDQLTTELDLKKAPHQETMDTVYFEGWVRSDRIERLKKSINDATEIYELEITDPLPEEEPPTFTKNNKFVAPFENITDMFAVPKPHETDPNYTMSIWYWIIFGMMMGDAGYGIVMFILFFGLIKIMKPKGESLKLYKVFMYSSITTFIWGVLFGSYFGATWKPILVEPLVDPLKMLILTLIVGGLHIITGLSVKAYDSIKNRNYFDAIFDNFSWIMILLGIGFIFIAPLKTIGVALIITGVIIVVLTAGRAKKNIFGKISGGLLGLYNITGYMSDVLSYSRILALSLSTAVIGMVMNMLAGMLQGSIIGIFFSIFVYLIGHVFNIAMGLLSAYVHDARLQYIEYFGKFYEGGGYKFNPLSLQLKYVNKININK